VSFLNELEGTGEEVGGTLGEAPGFGIQTLEAITPGAQVAQGVAKATGTPASGEVVKKAGGKAGSAAGKNAAKGAGEALTAAQGFAEKLAINSVLLLAGAFLIVYGVMVMVRPPDRATSIPVPPVAL
jgi:hypothetical protein